MEYRVFNNKNFLELITSQHSESRIFVNNLELYKILNTDKITTDRQSMVEVLSLLSHENCVFPNYGLTDETGSFCGYEMDYQQGYEVMSSYIKSNYIPFEIKKSLAHKLCRASEYLSKNNISFIDLHSENILIKDSSIKLIDLDGSRLISNLYPSSIRVRENIINERLALLSLFILFNREFEYDISSSNLKVLFRKLNDKQRSIFVKSFDENLMLKPVDLEESIESFDEEIVEYARHILRLR